MGLYHELKKDRPVHTYKGVNFQVITAHFNDTEADIQFVCFFDNTLNMTMEGGTADLDTHFDGQIKQLREKDLFRGKFLETLAITPTTQMKAKKMILIGLGDPNKLTADNLYAVGKLVVKEANKMGAKSVCFAPDIKDAGVTTVPTGGVSNTVAKGMMKSIDDVKTLFEMKLVDNNNLNDITFLAGAPHLNDSEAGLAETIV